MRRLVSHALNCGVALYALVCASSVLMPRSLQAQTFSQRMPLRVAQVATPAATPPPATGSVGSLLAAPPDTLPTTQSQPPATSSAATPPDVPPASESSATIAPPEAAESAEQLASPQSYHLPAARPSDQMTFHVEEGLVSLMARGAALSDVLSALAETQGLNLVMPETMDARIYTTLQRVPLDDALEVILSTNGYTWTRNRNVIQVTRVADGALLSPETQGRQVEVFRLHYVAATDVNAVVTSMLSPVGHSTIVSSAIDNNRRTEELLVVSDLPGYLDRIRQYICQHDVPPRQVLVEAYILQVELGDDMRHGVNLDHLLNAHNNLVQLETRGFANPNSTQAFFINLNGGNLAAVVECLETATDAKTLASPKIRVLNGQRARIQVGEQLGFRVTTTTETSTTESVDFIDVGVVLEVTPRISPDGTVIMRVRPEVSSGQVNPNTGLPQEETTELETDVMFHDNQAYVIGGLIQEVDADLQSKLPWIADWKHVGRLFQRRETNKNRSEIIIALLPRVLPYDDAYQAQIEFETERTRTPLLQPTLEEYPRPWEPRLPDAGAQPVYDPFHHLTHRLPGHHCAAECAPGKMYSPFPHSAPADQGPAQDMNGEVGQPGLPSPAMDEADFAPPPVDRGPPPVQISRLPQPAATKPATRVARLPAIHSVPISAESAVPGMRILR